MWAFVRLRGAAATTIVITSTILIFVLDFACYQRGVVRLGSGHALLTLIGVGVSYWIGEATETVIGLQKLRTRVLQDATGGSTEGEPEDLGSGVGSVALHSIHQTRTAARRIHHCSWPATRTTIQ